MPGANTEREKAMQYAVEVRLVRHMTLFVDAETEDQAKAAARRRIDVDLADEGDEWTIDDVALAADA